LSMASFLDWISTSFSHDQKKKHWISFWLSLNLFGFFSFLNVGE
jgi:hypothetical protein